MPSVNPAILRWARETAGLNLEEAADRLDIAEARGVPGWERLASYEAGENTPSRPLLLRMVKQYRRPLLAFYMSEVPRIAERGEDFRTLPPEHSRTQDALVDALIRDVRARQQIVRAALEDEDEAARLPFVASMTIKDGVDAVLQSIKKKLDLDVDRYRGQQVGKGALSGFAYLREQAEKTGIFVLLIGNLGSHHTNLDVDVFRGFALADDVAPFVVINDQDAESAWAFSLLHELCHIWLGDTGVSGTDAEKAVEQFCNEVAGRFFLPTVDLESLRDLHLADFKNVALRLNNFAEARRISGSMVAYRLYREGVIDRDIWSKLNSLYRRRWLDLREARRIRNREREGGPNYYVVRRHRLGEALLSLSRRMLAAGTFSPSKAAKVLGVKPSNVFSIVSPEIGPTLERATEG